MDSLRSHQNAVHQLNSKEKQILYSPKWGPLLHSELTMKPTLYSHLVADKSSVAVSSVDMVAKSSDLVKFQHGGFPKLEGFHPPVLSNSLLVAKEFLKIVKKFWVIFLKNFFLYKFCPISQIFLYVYFLIQCIVVHREKFWNNFF